MVYFHTHYLDLIREIEASIPVAEWTIGGVGVWPIVRMRLYRDMHRASPRKTRAVGSNAEASFGPGARKIIGGLAAPAIDAWRRRSDFRHVTLVPAAADMLFLGNGRSFELDDGAWEDRFCEPMAAACEHAGRSTFQMQPRGFRHLPLRRSTLAVRSLGARGRRRPAGSPNLSTTLPGHEQVMNLLASERVASPGISEASLKHEIADLLDTADEFERLLRIVAPRIAFFVSNYADLGPAFAVACRRRRILSVRLQHSAQIWHDMYSPAAVPAEGYETLPAVFWHWANAPTQEWMSGLPSGRHQDVHGGAPHLARWLDDMDPRTRSFDERVRAMRGAPADLNVLVALQHFDGYRDIWNGLAGIIENAPVNWRWWVRRKPLPDQLVSDDVFGRLVAIRRQNVIMEGVAELPLPALLRNVDACVTLMSGAAVEGALFGVQPIFLSEDARGLFPQLAAAGTPDIVSDLGAMHSLLARLAGSKWKRPHSPEIVEVVERLEDLSIAYSKL